MAMDSAADFVETIRRHKLIDAGKLQELVAETRGVTDPKALAQHFVKKGSLTPYQVNQIFTGQASGLVLGQYRILERLGEGGMGQVFKARHQAMGRTVALKVIRKDRLENDKAVRRFQREIQIAAQLVHPNIVMSFDADTISGVHFFAMECIEGVDLGRLVKEKGPLPVAVACHFVRQAALGLQYAHEHGLVHRDIKPSNLLVTRDTTQGPVGGKRGTKVPASQSVIKILDMGLARMAWTDEEATAASLSQDGSVLGTPDYMAPEQAKDAKTVDGRADIYSLGCTLYFLLTGQVPFRGSNSMEKLLKHQTEEAPPIDKMRSDVPGPVRALVKKMMAKRPEDRIQNCGEVADALAPYCDAATGAFKVKGDGVHVATMPTVAGGRSSTLPFSQWLTNRSPRRWLLVGLLGGGLLTALVICGGVLWLVSGSSAHPTQVAGRPTTGNTAKATPTAKQPASVHGSVVRYLPDNAHFIWVYNYKEYFQSPFFQQNETTIKQNWKDLSGRFLDFGIDLYKDVDRGAFSTHAAADNSGLPPIVWILQGSFDRGRLEQAMPRGSFRQLKNVPNSGYYHLPIPGSKRGEFLAMPNANTFILATEEFYMIEALTKAAGLKPAILHAKEVQAVLENLDEKPTMMLVAGSNLAGPDKNTLGSRGIRLAVFGFKVASDVQADYSLTVNDVQMLRANREKAVPFFISLFPFLGRVDGAVLAENLKNTDPVIDVRAQTISVHTRYSPAEMLRAFFPK
jgi:serine/threonine-protein kinase